MSAVHGSENQPLMVLDDRLVDIREALLTNDPKLGSLHQSRPDPATLNAQFKWMSLNVANCVSNKWHNLKSLTVETQSLGPKIYARSPEQNTMMDLTKIQYALSGIWATAPTMPSTDGETDTSKFYMLFEPMPYRNIP